MCISIHKCSKNKHLNLSFERTIKSIAFVISVVIWKTGKKIENRIWAICLGAMLGGAIGNLLDRIFRSPVIFRGAVVDFFQIPYWAIFNIADMAVSVSATIVAIMTIFGKDPYKKSNK